MFKKPHLRIEGPCVTDVALQSIGRELWVDGCIPVPMDVDDMGSDGKVGILVAFVKDDEEEVESRHDGSRHGDVGTETDLAVVSPSDGVGCGKDGGARVEGSLDARFGDGDRLLFHRFVDGDLVGKVHLVKLVDAADTVVCEHESTGFDGEFTRLLVPDDCCCQTSCGGCLARGVDGSRQEAAYVPIGTKSQSNIPERSTKGAPFTETYFRNWDLLVLGSPTIQMLRSPRRWMPSAVSLCTPPMSCRRMPFLTISWPGYAICTVRSGCNFGTSQRNVTHSPYTVGAILLTSLE